MNRFHRSIARLVAVWSVARRAACIAAGTAAGDGAAGLPAGDALSAGHPLPPASIVHLVLPAESDQRIPVAIPTEPGATVELDFPWVVEDWAGRGFTPDPEKYAGDFVVDAVRGRKRMYVTPVATGAHRVLHVVLAPSGGEPLSVPLEFIPAPAGYAWRKVLFADRAPASGPDSMEKPAPNAGVDGHTWLLPEAPGSRFREPTPETELGLVRTMRLLLNRPGDLARGVLEANPSLRCVPIGRPPRSFGDFTLTLRFALRDDVTDCLGLCVDAANATGRRLLFDPLSWVVRVGDRVYPVRTVDFAGEVEPGGTQAAFLVLARGQDGLPTRLLPENEFAVSVALAGSANPRPVRRFALEDPDGR